MSVITIPTTFNIDVSFPSAPFHRRLIAWMIDLVLMVTYLLLIRKVIITTDPDFDKYPVLEGLFTLLIYIPLLTYHLVCEIAMKGRSVGKRIMGLRVISENGGRPAISQVIIRWIIRTSDIMVFMIILNGATGGAIGGMQFVWRTLIAFLLLVTDIILVNATAKNQRLGDLLAHTILISTKQKAGFEDTIFLNVKENYTPSFPQVMQLSDRDVNALKGILDTAKKQHDYNLAERASEKLKSHLNIDTTLSPFDFLETLLQDYNYLTAH
jgi:uncharacterized RDD family membrane protein YckC